MREPAVVPMDKSPFAFDVPAAERHERMLAQSADLLTDELGIIVGFSGEEDVEALLNDPRFGAVAMATLQMSGVTDGATARYVVVADVRQGWRKPQAGEKCGRTGVHAPCG